MTMHFSRALTRGTSRRLFWTSSELSRFPPTTRSGPHPSIRVTPHNAAGGSGRFQRQADLFKENLDRYLDGRPFLNEVTDAIASQS